MAHYPGNPVPHSSLLRHVCDQDGHLGALAVDAPDHHVVLQDREPQDHILPVEVDLALQFGGSVLRVFVFKGHDDWL